MLVVATELRIGLSLEIVKPSLDRGGGRGGTPEFNERPPDSDLKTAASSFVSWNVKSDGHGRRAIAPGRGEAESPGSYGFLNAALHHFGPGRKPMSANRSERT